MPLHGQGISDWSFWCSLAFCFSGNKKILEQSGLVVHAFSPALGMERLVDLCDLRLVWSTQSSRTARAREILALLLCKKLTASLYFFFLMH